MSIYYIRCSLFKLQVQHSERYTLQFIRTAWIVYLYRVRQQISQHLKKKQFLGLDKQFQKF